VASRCTLLKAMHAASMVSLTWVSIGPRACPLHRCTGSWQIGSPLVPANLWRVSCVKLLYAKDQITWGFQHGKVASAMFGGSGICCGATLRCGVSPQLVARCRHRARPGYNPPGAPNCHGPIDVECPISLPASKTDPVVLTTTKSWVVFVMMTGTYHARITRW